MSPVAALCVPSTVGAVQMTVSLVVVPSAGGAAPAITGVFGAYAPVPAVAVLSVLVTDPAHTPVMFELWT